MRFLKFGIIRVSDVFKIEQLKTIVTVACLLFTGQNSLAYYGYNNTYNNPFAKQPSYYNDNNQFKTTNLPNYPKNQLIPAQYFATGKPNLSCVAYAAQRRGLPVDLMLAIQSVERGQTGQQVRNSNATYDLGAFQINTIHLPRIEKLGGNKQDILQKGCFNAEVASLLLYEAMTHPKKQHHDFYTRAAGYHSWTPKYNQTYKTKLIQYLNQWQIWLKNNNLGHLISSPVVR